MFSVREQRTWAVYGPAGRCDISRARQPATPKPQPQAKTGARNRFPLKQSPGGATEMPAMARLRLFTTDGTDDTDVVTTTATTTAATTAFFSTTEGTESTEMVKATAPLICNRSLVLRSEPTPP